ncbi:hypothetical protein [Arenibaculum pallidiluteum]|uniref:hypothetical protein n=1 Tax=Arenibaculum pallidiluteum TaxID=2812559 RepID=UPI001A967274|nr:hypothetical protein [Arenibaculum pallidiluteum]
MGVVLGGPAEAPAPCAGGDFARDSGKLVKNDALGAEVIPLLAERIRPEPHPVSETEDQGLGPAAPPGVIAAGSDRRPERTPRGGIRPAHG